VAWAAGVDHDAAVLVRKGAAERERGRSRAIEAEQLEVELGRRERRRERDGRVRAVDHLAEEAAGVAAQDLEAGIAARALDQEGEAALVGRLRHVEEADQLEVEIDERIVGAERSASRAAPRAAR
jgi:hypothetical protein